MPTLAELLQQIEGGQRSLYGEKGLQLTKAGTEDIRALKQADIALVEEERERAREIEQAGKRGTGSRYFTKFIDWITQSPLGSMLSAPLQEATKTRRFTLDSPFGEKVKDPYRALETEAPDTTFYGTAGKKLESKIKTVSDFIGDAERMYDESKIANVMTDLITSYQTQAAGFTPEYAGDILSKTGEEGIFGAIKSAEASRRGKLIDEYKDLWNRPKVGAEGGRASAVSPEAFAKAFGKDPRSFAPGQRTPFEIISETGLFNPYLSERRKSPMYSRMLENPVFRNILPLEYSRTDPLLQQLQVGKNPLSVAGYMSNPWNLGE